MLPVNRLAVWLIVSILALIGLPMAVAGEQPIADMKILTPVVLAIELIVYFVLTMMASPRMNLSTVLGLSIIMVVMRGLCSAAGYYLAALLLGQQGDFLVTWVGNPLAVFFQFIVIALATPHILAAANPGIVDKELAEKLGLGGLSSGGDGGPRVHESNPTGGFVQVFSYEELEGVLRKTHGLKGFVICSSEGLVVWRDIQGIGDPDELTAKVMALSSQMGRTLEDSGLNRLEGVVVATKDAILTVHELNANFGLVLAYDKQTKMSEIDSKAAVLVKTAREYLQWKYPGLAVA